MDWHADVEPRFRPLVAPAGERAWEKHLRDDILGHDDWCVLVAERNGEVMGQIIGRVRGNVPVFEPARYGCVTDIVVAAAERREGVGLALFSALKDWFRELGVNHLQLQVAHNNPAAQGFWRGQGCTDYIHTLWYDLGQEKPGDPSDPRA